MNKKTALVKDLLTNLCCLHISAGVRSSGTAQRLMWWALAASVTSSAGNLFVSGCRQKDALGLLKPAVVISKLSLSNLADSSWVVTTNSSSVTPGVSLSAVPYSSAVTVKSAIHISKTTSQSTIGLAGELTLVNKQVVPYVIAGVRVIITRNATASITGDPAAGGVPQQFVLEANCPLTPQGNLVIPPQLLSAVPGVLRCTFTLPLNSSSTAGTVQAQLRTLFSASYEVDSGLPTPYSFAANATAEDVASDCVEVWGQRITDASQVQTADMDVNLDLAAVMGSLSQPGVHLAAAPKRVVSGRVPPSHGSLLAIPYRVCGNKSIEWTESHGPLTCDSCGMNLVSFMALHYGMTYQQCLRCVLILSCLQLCNSSWAAPLINTSALQGL